MVQEHEQRQTIGIIGAGVAGLQVAAALRKAGLHVKLFELSSTVGGVWQKNYTGYSLQVCCCSQIEKMETGHTLTLQQPLGCGGQLLLLPDHEPDEPHINKT